MSEHTETLDLLDWKRRIFALYQEIRSSDDPSSAWDQWRKTRDEMFHSHPQSPIPAQDRAAFDGVALYQYDPRY